MTRRSFRGVCLGERLCQKFFRLGCNSYAGCLSQNMPSIMGALCADATHFSGDGTPSPTAQQLEAKLGYPYLF